LTNTNPNSALNMGNVVIEESADDSNEKLQNWISNLQIFLEDHFFPAFELQKKIDEVLNKTKINTNSTWTEFELLPVYANFKETSFLFIWWDALNLLKIAWLSISQSLEILIIGKPFLYSISILNA